MGDLYCVVLVDDDDFVVCDDLVVEFDVGWSVC